MKTYLRQFVQFGILSMLAAACNKKLSDNFPVNPVSNKADDNRTVNLTREVAHILEKVYDDKEAYKEVNAAIYSGYYEDERVLLSDLLFPASSKLYASNRFRILKIDTGLFRKRFCEILDSGNYPLLRSELKVLLYPQSVSHPSMISNDALIYNDTGAAVLSIGQPVSIYFPYSENFLNSQNADSMRGPVKFPLIKEATIVYSDRESDTGTGKEPFYCSSGSPDLCYRTVVVHEGFVQTKPTHIITTGPVAINSPAPAVPKSELVTRVYHGSSRLTRQMDKLISFTGNGGGSEIKVCRINGYLRKTDEQINDFAGDVVTLHYTRADISKKRWKRIFSVWDPNWNYQDIEQIYAVYEDDTQGSKTVNGNLTTTLTIPGKFGKAEGEIGFKIQVMTQDEIITQRKIDRKSYLRDGMNNQGWGFSYDANDFLPVAKDWPIYDGGTIWNFTMPLKIY